MCCLNFYKRKLDTVKKAHGINMFRFLSSYPFFACILKSSNTQRDKHAFHQLFCFLKEGSYSPFGVCVAMRKSALFSFFFFF